MRPTSAPLLFYYCLSIGISVAAAIFAYSSFMVSVVGFLMASSFTFWSLTATGNTTEDNNPYCPYRKK